MLDQLVKLLINSDGTIEIMQAVSEMTLEDQALGEGKGHIYTADEQGRNANYDIAKDIQGINQLFVFQLNVLLLTNKQVFLTLWRYRSIATIF